MRGRPSGAELDRWDDELIREDLVYLAILEELGVLDTMMVVCFWQ